MMFDQGLFGGSGGSQGQLPTPSFPTYGGPTQSAGLLNDYLAQLMAPRQPYMPPQLQTLQKMRNEQLFPAQSAQDPERRPFWFVESDSYGQNMKNWINSIMGRWAP
jgi:hypothetical protein